MVYWFSKDGKRPRRSCALSHPVVSVSRNDHDWDLQTPGRQLVLHLKAAHSRQRKVQNHACDQAQVTRPHKLFPRREGLDLVSPRYRSSCGRLALMCVASQAWTVSRRTAHGAPLPGPRRCCSSGENPGPLLQGIGPPQEPEEVPVPLEGAGMVIHDYTRVMRFPGTPRDRAYRPGCRPIARWPSGSPRDRGPRGGRR